MKETQVSNFVRAFPLPKKADVDGIKTDIQDERVEIVIPKKIG
jgi:HSP20 family molecular chaperone IbpA